MKRIWYSHLKAARLRTLGIGPIAIDVRVSERQHLTRYYFQVYVGKRILRVRKLR